MSPVEFLSPNWLFLLPLALLPWLPRFRDAITFPATFWIPTDTLGLWLERLWRSLATLTLLSLILAMAGPGTPETSIERIGRGAELFLLLDRSASMDAHVRRVTLKPGEQPRPNESKNSVVRGALAWLINQRPENRYGLTVFNVSTIPVSPLTDDPALVLAGLEASGIGRGPNKTHMGLALVKAIERFDNRSYTGSRAILLVSDGGAKLDEDTRRKISEGLKRNRVNLYFIYIQSSDNSPDLETVGINADETVEEIALHVFFQGLDTEYRVFQANNLESMSEAVTEIDQQHNQPLTYQELVPRVDYLHVFLWLALLSCVLLLALEAIRLERLS